MTALSALSDLIARLVKRTADEMEYHCVNGHDLCHGGASAGTDCPYCERRATPDGELFLEIIAALKAREEAR